VLLQRRSDFRSRPPHPEDVFLLVEVADTSLAYDRETKIPLYAESGIPEAWLVDLNSDTISVYRRPSPNGYQEVRQYRRGDTISPEAFPEARFAVDDLLP
jgi:Uma2 family endonuclease